MSRSFLLSLFLTSFAAAPVDARRPRRASSARQTTTARATQRSNDAAAEYARANAEVAELKSARELPVAAREDLDFPGQQLDDSERPQGVKTPQKR